MTTPRPATPEAAAILARRAQALAAGDAASEAYGAAGEAGAAGAARATVAVLVVQRGGATFALRAVDVRDVRRAARVTPLPGAERPVAGLAAWRGQGIVVLDVFAGAPVPAAPGGATVPWLLVVGDRRGGDRGDRGDRGELALLADEVHDVVDLDLGALVPAPDGAPPSHGATTDGMLLLDLRGWLAHHPAS